MYVVKYAKNLLSGYLDAITEEKDKVIPEVFNQGFVDGAKKGMMYGQLLGKIEYLIKIAN